MREYTVEYRVRGQKDGDVFETSLTAASVKAAREAARQDLEKKYVIVSCRLA